MAFNRDNKMITTTDRTVILFNFIPIYQFRVLLLIPLWSDEDRSIKGQDKSIPSSISKIL